MGRGFKIMVEGPLACFTRPEMKVERVSYDVPTPGALEGLIKSIYWKPAVRYVIDQIVVFHPVDFINIRRNEVRDKVLLSAVRKQMSGSEAADPSIYTSECRSQRAAMVLKNVCYGVEFHFECTGFKDDSPDEAKHYNILLRRLRGGQSFRQPCLGCAEFPASRVTLVEDFDLTQIAPELVSAGDVDLGYMLYRMRFVDGGVPVNGDWEHPRFSDQAVAEYYHPHMIGGVINVSEYRRDVKC